MNKLFPFRPAGISPKKFPRWQKLHKSLAICSNSLSNIDTAFFYVKKQQMKLYRQSKTQFYIKLYTSRRNGIKTRDMEAESGGSANFLVEAEAIANRKSGSAKNLGASASIFVPLLLLLLSLSLSLSLLLSRIYLS